MRRFLIIVSLLFSQAILAANEGLVVITSNHSDFEIGAIIDQTQLIDLSSGESIKLVSSSGKVISLQGPYKGSIIFDSRPTDRSVLESISKLVKDSKPTDFTLAIFRKAPSSKPTERLDIWGIDIRHSGNYCIRDNHPTYLWWPRPISGKEITLSKTPGPQSTKIKWPTNKKYYAWPSTFDIEDKSDYTISSGTASQKTNFKLLFIPGALSSKMEVVAWMSERNCRRQATRLLASILNDA